MNNKPSLSLPRVTKVTPDNLCDFTKSAKRKLKSMSASEFEAFLAFKPGTEKFIRSVGGKNAFLIQQYQFWQFPGFMDYIRTMPDYKPFIYMVEKEVNNRVHSKFEQMTKYVPGFGGCSHYHKWALGILGSPKDKYGFHEFIKKESKVLHDNDVQIEKEYLRKIEEAARIQQAAKSKMLQRRAVWLEEQAAQDAKLSLDENFENYAGDLDDVYFDEIKVETYELTNQAINHLEKFGFDTEGFSSCEGNVYQRFLQKELVETVNQTSEVLEAFADDYHINNISTLIYDFANEAISFISEDKIEIGLELCEFCSDLLELGKAVALELQEEETDIRIQNKLNPILDIVFHQVNQTENLDVLIDNASLSFCKIALLCHEDEANVNQLAQFPSLNSNLEFNPVEKILNQTKEILDVVNEEGSFWAARTLEQINTDPNLIKIHGSIKNAFEAIIIENKKQFEEEMAENDYPYDPDDDPWIVYSFEDSGESECKTRIQVTGEPSIDPDPEDPKDKDKKKRKLRDSESSKYKHSIKGQLKKHKLPTKGKIRFVPSKSNLDIGKITYKIINGAKNFTDKFGNIWQAGRSITAGENIEWDVQLFRQGIQQLGWASRSGKHINVSLKGIITH